MKYARPKTARIVAAQFDRAPGGPSWTGASSIGDIPISGLPGWQSNGGPTKLHPGRCLPFALDIEAPTGLGQLSRVYVVGVYGLWSDTTSPGASVQLLEGDEIVFHQELWEGRHYSDPFDPTPLSKLLGDGTSVETVGSVELQEGRARVDLITVDVPAGLVPTRLRFKDLGTSASFILFDAAFEFQVAPGCPFKAKTGGVSLSEVASVVRLGDRFKLNLALDQLEDAVCATEDLDEARGEALTFLAVVCAATIEMGAPREMHRVQLEAARSFDEMADRRQIALATRAKVESIVAHLFAPAESPTAALIDRALAIVDRHYARDLSDAGIAAELGLSTSHFRFLFRQATGQPFHRYLIALRLEKAKQRLLDEESPVSDIASEVGFTGLSHFSRAFAQRFAVSPSTLRRQGR